MAVESLNKIKETRDIESSVDENTLIAAETGGKIFGVTRLFEAVKKAFDYITNIFGNKVFENNVEIKGTLNSNDLTSRLNEKVSFQKRVTGNYSNSISIEDLPNGVYMATGQDLYHNAKYIGSCLFVKYSTSERHLVNFANATLNFSLSGNTLSASPTNLYLYNCNIVKLI